MRSLVSVFVHLPKGLTSLSSIGELRLRASSAYRVRIRWSNFEVIVSGHSQILRMNTACIFSIKNHCLLGQRMLTIISILNQYLLGFLCLKCCCKFLRLRLCSSWCRLVWHTCLMIDCLFSCQFRRHWLQVVALRMCVEAVDRDILLGGLLRRCRHDWIALVLALDQGQYSTFDVSVVMLWLSGAVMSAGSEDRHFMLHELWQLYMLLWFGCDGCRVVLNRDWCWCYSYTHVVCWWAICLPLWGVASISSWKGDLSIRYVHILTAEGERLTKYLSAVLLVLSAPIYLANLSDFDGLMPHNFCLVGISSQLIILIFFRWWLLAEAVLSLTDLSINRDLGYRWQLRFWCDMREASLWVLLVILVGISWQGRYATEV